MEKRALPVFKYSNYLPSSQKSQKTNASFLRKMKRQTDRQTDSYFVGPPTTCKSLNHKTNMQMFR